MTQDGLVVQIGNAAVRVTRTTEVNGVSISWGTRIFKGADLDDEERIVHLVIDRREVIVGQRVVTRQNDLVAEGLHGTVLSLHAPLSSGRTSDVIDCNFEPRGSKPVPVGMKIEELTLLKK
ncbi:hypothetical protein HQ524_01800 [Candidatus Uhrbacteria bacterium]|nr:hypothetical protein [Candidatus Uhrbacteria bacterium]